jgi:hypothetical protein
VLFREDCKKCETAGEIREAADDLNAIQATHISIKHPG